MSISQATKKNVDPFCRKLWLNMVDLLLDNMTDFRQESV